MMTNGDPEGQSFLLAPHRHDITVKQTRLTILTLDPTLAKFITYIIKEYGHFLQNFRGPAQNVWAISYWAPVNFFH